MGSKICGSKLRECQAIGGKRRGHRDLLTFPNMDVETIQSCDASSLYGIEVVGKNYPRETEMRSKALRSSLDYGRFWGTRSIL